MPLPYLLSEKLRGSDYDSPQEITTMARYFHKSVMPRFRVNQKSCFIKFGRPTDNNPSLDIKLGSIRLERYIYGPSLATWILTSPSAQVASFLEPSVQGIAKVIEEKYASSPIPIKVTINIYLHRKLSTSFGQTLCLVGGFATSEYLFTRLKEVFKGRIQILRPDGYLYVLFLMYS